MKAKTNSPQPTPTRVIHWFRRDLRLDDNTALAAAFGMGAVIPVFIFDPAILHGERFGLARTAFMLAGLRDLAAQIAARGGQLVIRHGDPRVVLPQLADTFDAAAVTANRDYSPYAVKRDPAVDQALGRRPLHLYDDALIHAPEQIVKKDGAPYTVYTPFRKAWLLLPKPLTVTTAGTFAPVNEATAGTVPTLADLGLPAESPVPLPPAGQDAAQRRLAGFTAEAIHHYRERRNHLFVNPFTTDAPLTSGLSPYLRLGMLSPRQAYAAAVAAKNTTRSSAERDSVDVWISELAWRDFYNHILYHFPHVYHDHFRREFSIVPFRDHRPGGAAADEYARWQAGQTGYPIIDAAMRQVQQVGWIHNRARMIVASFLTKHLLIHWKAGDVHFMRSLLDGDPAANNGGWQWAAGTGTDAQPYFRIFNPVSQAQQFDPDGSYIRHFVPELRDVPTAFIHAPWTLSSPPPGYPAPIVDHMAARQRALAAYGAVKAARPTAQEPQLL